MSMKSKPFKFSENCPVMTKGHFNLYHKINIDEFVLRMEKMQCDTTPVHSAYTVTPWTDVHLVPHESMIMSCIEIVDIPDVMIDEAVGKHLSLRNIYLGVNPNPQKVKVKRHLREMLDTDKMIIVDLVSSQHGALRDFVPIQWKKSTKLQKSDINRIIGWRWQVAESQQMIRFKELNKQMNNKKQSIRACETAFNSLSAKIERLHLKIELNKDAIVNMEGEMSQLKKDLIKRGEIDE